MKQIAKSLLLNNPPAATIGRRTRPDNQIVITKIFQMLSYGSKGDAKNICKLRICYTWTFSYGFQYFIYCFCRSFGTCFGTCFGTQPIFTPFVYGNCHKKSKPILVSLKNSPRGTVGPKFLLNCMYACGTAFSQIQFLHATVYFLQNINKYLISLSLDYRLLKYLKMIYGYIRVSSDKQTVENQRFEINKFVEKEKMHIDGWIEETISGTKNYNKRQLGKLLKRVQKDDLIICAELSRLGRNLFMIMEILNICMTKECRVWTIKDNYRLGEDIQSKVLAFAFGLSAEIERNLISQRTKEALARKKAEGIILGRPKGRKTDFRKYKLYGKETLIKRLLNGNISKQRIAKICKVNRNTLAHYITDNMSEDE